MKKFIEEYGFAILGAIVVILLIALCTPIGTLIKNEVSSIVGSMAGRTESKLSQVDGNLLLSQDGSNFKLRMKSDSTTNKYKVEFRFKGKNGWENWVSYGNLLNPYEVTYSSLPFEVVKKLDIQARVLDTGKDNKEASVSNIITYKGDKLEVGEAPAYLEPEEGYIKEIYDANGGVYPNGENSLYVIFNTETNEVERTNFPSDVNVDSYSEMRNYLSLATRAGYMFAGVLEYPQPTEGKSGVTLFKIKWTGEDEFELVYRAIYHAGEGVFPDGSKDLQVDTYCLPVTRIKAKSFEASVPLTSSRVGSCYIKVNGTKVEEIPEPILEGKEFGDWIEMSYNYDEELGLETYEYEPLWFEPLWDLQKYDLLTFVDNGIEKRAMYLGYDGTDVYLEEILSNNSSTCWTRKVPKEELEGNYTIVGHNFTPTGCAEMAY